MHSETIVSRGWQERIESGLCYGVLAVVFLLSCALGFATPYVLVAVIVLATIYLLLARGVDWTPDGMSRVFIATFLGLGAVFAITADEPRDVLSVFNFIAFALYWPLVVLLGRRSRRENAAVVAGLALAGTAVGFGLSILQVFVLHTGRAGAWISDPIRLANTAVILGFLAAAMGAGASPGRFRWLYLLGPLLALGTVFLAGARIAMIAYPPLLILLVLLLVRNKLAGLALALGLAAAAILLGFALGGDRMALLVASVADVASGHAPDEAVRIRLVLYEAAWRAFVAAPIFGYGWGNMMSTVGALLPEADKVQALLPHLHNEVLNFAVFGGLVGMALYALLMAAPIVLALRMARDSQYTSRLHGAIVVVAAYLLMGLTDTMVSFETHTALYVGLLAAVLGFCRDERYQNG